MGPVDLQQEGVLQRHVMALIVAHLRDNNLSQVLAVQIATISLVLSGRAASLSLS